MLKDKFKLALSLAQLSPSLLVTYVTRIGPKKYLFYLGAFPTTNLHHQITSIYHFRFQVLKILQGMGYRSHIKFIFFVNFQMI